jgi:hypothetical protein
MANPDLVTVLLILAAITLHGALRRRPGHERLGRLGT